MSSINPLRGTCQVTLGEQQVTLRLNNNTFRIACEKRKSTFSQFLQDFQQGGENMLNLLYDIIEAAYINDLHYRGQKCEVPTETIQAWIGDMTDEDVNKILAVINSSVNLKPEKKGNAIAEETPQNP